MDTTSKVLFGVGAVLAALVGVTLYMVLIAAPGLGRATTAVVVARQAIPDRTLFTATNVGELLTTRRLPVDAVPPGALTDPSQAIARTTTIALAPGEIVLDTPDRLVSGEGGTAGRPSAAIPRGQLALTVNAGESVNITGAVQPGDRVDVIATWNRSDGQSVTQNIFQDVRVFTVGRWQGDGRGRADGDRPASGGSAASVTLLLDYQQAVILEHLLQAGGRVVLGLRRFDQSGEVPTEPVTTESLTRRFGVDGDARAR